MPPKANFKPDESVDKFENAVVDISGGKHDSSGRMEGLQGQAGAQVPL